MWTSTIGEEQVSPKLAYKGLPREMGTVPGYFATISVDSLARHLGGLSEILISIFSSWSSENGNSRVCRCDDFLHQEC